MLVKAVGDFDGNGRADILFQNMATNEVRISSNSIGTINFNALTPVTPAPVASEHLEVIGTGDFNGDGASDLLWHDLAANTFEYWSFHNANTTESTTHISFSGVTSLFGIAHLDARESNRR